MPASRSAAVRRWSLHSLWCVCVWREGAERSKRGGGRGASTHGRGGREEEPPSRQYREGYSDGVWAPALQTTARQSLHCMACSTQSTAVNKESH